VKEAPHFGLQVTGGNTNVVEILIASGRDLGNLRKAGTAFEDLPLEISNIFLKNEAMNLLQRFTVNQAQTRHEVRVTLGVLDELAAGIFALIVFLCDDLLQLKPALATTTTTASSNPTAVRFFTMVSKLPMELQMLLCHRAVGSKKQNILRKDSEAAFQALARILLQSN